MQGRPGASLAVAALSVAAGATLSRAGAGPVDLLERLSAPGGWLRSGPDAALLDLLALGAWAAAAWLVLTVALTALGTAPGRVGILARSVVRMTSPALLRRAAESMLCLGLVAGAVGGSAAAAAAAPLVDPAAGTAAATGDPDTAGTDWPTAPAPPGPSRAAEPAEVVVVQRGDSLWRLAERALGPGADPAAVAAEWPRWHDANRAVIGADPDLLLPGQQLRPPA